ncbi:MAG TPA: hypothetical protein VFZ32_06660 [Micromonosporaceae bacterium]
MSRIFMVMMMLAAAVPPPVFRCRRAVRSATKPDETRYGAAPGREPDADAGSEGVGTELYVVPDPDGACRL